MMASAMYAHVHICTHMVYYNKTFYKPYTPNVFSFGGKNQYNVKVHKPSVRIPALNITLQNASSRVKHFIHRRYKSEQSLTLNYTFLYQ